MVGFAIGTGYYGKVDRIPGLCYVSTRFCHICLFPMFPLESYLILDMPEDRRTGVRRGMRIPISLTSVLIAWLRAICLPIFLAGGVTIPLMLIVLAAGVPGSEPLPTMILIGTIFFVPSLALFGLSYLVGKASPRRAVELGARLGIPAETVQKILATSKDERVLALEAYLRAHPEVLVSLGGTASKTKGAESRKTAVHRRRN